MQVRSLVQNRRVSFGVLLAIALVAAACSGGGATDSDVPSSGNDVTTTEVVVPETTTTTTDVSETTTTTTESLSGQDVSVGMAYDAGGRVDSPTVASAAAGLDRAVAELGVVSSELETSSDGTNREGILGLLAQSGSDPVVAVGPAFADGVASAAATYPDTNFVIVGAVVDAPNITSLVFAEHEGSAIVGAAAALKTATNKIGLIVGLAGTELVDSIQAGYQAGAQEIDPEVEMVVEHLTEATTSEEAKDLAVEMFESGADIIYFAVDSFDAGVFEAAQEASDEGESKVWVIGFVSDRYETAAEEVQPYILTSMIERVDAAVFDTINTVVTGNEQSGVVLLDLGADGVGYSTSGGFVDDISDQLDELRTRIVTGDLVIPTELDS